MNRATKAAATAALALLTLTCVRAAAQYEIITDLMTLYEERDYFELRSRLDTLPGLSGPRVELLRAAVAHAFNDPNRSNRHLEELGEEMQGLPDTLRVDPHEIRIQNHIRLHRYGAALDATRALLALSAADSSTRQNASNFARALKALADAPAQRMVSRAASRIERRPDTRVPVKIGDSTRGYVLDTGANLSTMMRSEADSLGLRVREAGVEVGTSTGSKVAADHHFRGSHPIEATFVLLEDSTGKLSRFNPGRASRRVRPGIPPSDREGARAFPRALDHRGDL